MDKLFLQELNAITNYANTSNTDFTEEAVRKMLRNLLCSKESQLYGSRCHPNIEIDIDTKEEDYE